MNELTPEALTERRERVFIALAAVFLSAMTLLNVIGITKFIQLGPFALAVGVLPYPITFLCTDLICELYGKKRANFLVTVGLFINGFILLVMTVAQYAASVDPSTMPPWQTLDLASPVPLPTGDSLEGILGLWSENVWLAARGGGIGSYWGNLRSIGEKIGKVGKTSGIIPFIKVMDSLTLAISQG